MIRFHRPSAAVLAAIALTTITGTAAQERDRARIPDKYRWDLTAIYPSDDAWRNAKEALAAEIPKIGAYKGTLAGDEIKFTRMVGEFATEELVAKRAE